MGKTVLISGGSRGIGLAIAHSLAKEGWHIAVNGVRPQTEAEETLEELRQWGTEVIYCPGNIGEAEDRERMVQAVTGHFGQLNALVNNAGVAPLQRLDVLETSEESFDRVLDINLKGTFFLSQRAARELIACREQHPEQPAGMVNITSISATVVSINRGEYCISKAGLSMVTQLFATRLAEYGIPVFEVRPGVIRTDMTAGVQEKYERLFAQGLALQARWGLPDEVGKAVAALLRGDFPYSTGQSFLVDGGLTIQRL